MKKIEFGGVSTKLERAKSFSRNFDTIIEDDDSLYVSKKTYRHEEDDFTFDYNLLVRVEDLYSMSGEDEHKDKFYVELLMLPTKEYFNKSKLEDVAHCSGIDTSEVNYYDIVSYGFGVQLSDEVVYAKSWNSKNLKDRLNAVATTYDTINNLRGFYLDRSWNRIGTTGWDSLCEIINGSDAILDSINRLQKH